jgi:hypothetical protein
LRSGTTSAPLALMRTIGLGAALAVSVVLLLAVWIVGKALGFHVSLLGSLGMTVLLTVLVNVVLAIAIRRRRRF